MIASFDIFDFSPRDLSRVILAFRAQGV